MYARALIAAVPYCLRRISIYPSASNRKNQPLNVQQRNKSNHRRMCIREKDNKAFELTFKREIVSFREKRVTAIVAFIAVFPRFYRCSSVAAPGH